MQCPVGIRQIEVRSWTEAGGQDDLKSFVIRPTVKKGSSSALIRTADHGYEGGLYHAEVILTDYTGTTRSAAIRVTVPAPRPLYIRALSVKEISAAGYTVQAEFTAKRGILEVLMPTWTAAGGQDDLIWHRAQVNGDTAVFRVRTTDHRQESGTYITHVYVRDQSGAEVLEGLETDVPAPGSPDEGDNPAVPPNPPAPAPGNLPGPGQNTTVFNGTDYSPVWDADWYLNRYPDLRAAFGTDTMLAFNHFITFGMQEGRQGNAAFLVTAYRNRYADLNAAFGDSLPSYYLHYIRYGIRENRRGN